MATTPVYGFPYQGVGDAPDGPSLGEDLALAVESKFQSVDSSVAAITGLTHVVGSSTATFTSTSLSFEAGATPFGVSFTAPPSGVVYVTLSGYFRESQDGGVALMSWTMRTGGTVGSGTLVGTAANPHRALITGGVVTTGKPIYYQGSRRSVVSGLTPGNTYNVRVEVAVDFDAPAIAAGIDVVYRELIIEPSV